MNICLNEYFATKNWMNCWMNEKNAAFIGKMNIMLKRKTSSLIKGPAEYEKQMKLWYGHTMWKKRHTKGQPELQFWADKTYSGLLGILNHFPPNSWIEYWIEYFWLALEWIFWLNEYFRIHFELNIELNHFWAQFNVWLNNQNVSARATDRGCVASGAIIQRLQGKKDSIWSGYTWHKHNF